MFFSLRFSLWSLFKSPRIEATATSSILHFTDDNNGGAGCARRRSFLKKEIYLSLRLYARGRVDLTVCQQAKRPTETPPASPWVQQLNSVLVRQAREILKKWTIRYTRLYDDNINTSIRKVISDQGRKIFDMGWQRCRHLMLLRSLTAG